MTTLTAPVRDDAGLPLTARTRAGLGYALFALVTYGPILLTHPGKVEADTKSYLYLDPGRVLTEAGSMWDPHIGLGTVSHQTIGYLFPLGPFYWLLEQGLGVPAWVAQRLWLGSLLFLAGLGMRYLLRTFGMRGPGVPVAMLAFAFTPYALEFSGRLSVLLGPWAALPWMLAFVVLALRHGGWKYPALFAITVQLVGGVNATALLYAGIGPALWIPYSVLILRDSTWRRAWTVVWRTGALTLLTSLWWISGLWAQGKYGLDILRFTESIQTVSFTSFTNEVLRGLGYWFFYGRDKIGLWNTAMLDFTQRPWLIFVSYLIPTLALLAAAVIRWRNRTFFVLLALVGVVIAVAASPYDDPSILGSVFKAFATGSTAGFALRSTARAVPLMALGFAALLGAGITALSDWLRTRGLSWAGIVVAALVGALVLANAPGIWHGQYYSRYLERDEQLPQYWTRALAYVDAQSHDTRVLALPGSDFAAYRWGDTIDPIEPGLIDRPYVARELVPWGSAASANLLQALDHRVQEQGFEPASLAPVARLMGVGDVLLRMDLQTDRFNLVPSRLLWRDFSPTSPPGLASARTFGTTIPGRLRFPDQGDVTRPPEPGSTPPPVAVLAVQEPLTVVRVKPSTGTLLVDGDGEGLVDAAAAGALDARRLVVYSPGLARDPAALRKQLTPGTTLVVTDTNRRRGERWSGLRDNYGYTEQAGEQPMQEDLLDQRLEVFPDAPDTARTVTEFGGVRSIQATSYGSPFFGFTPDQRPALALDGDPETAWEADGGIATVPHERLRIVLNHPITTDHVNLAQPSTGARGRWITRVTLRFDGRRAVTRVLGRPSRTKSGQVVTFPSRTFRRFEIRIEATYRNPIRSRISASGRARFSGVGFAEIGLQDAASGSTPIRARETVRMPRDLLAAAGPAAAEHPLVLVMSRLENALHRSFSLPDARSFALTGSLRLIPGADDAALDPLLGIPGLAAGYPTASARQSLGDLRSRASSAIDGDPTTAWHTPYNKVRNRRIRVDTPQPVTFDHLALQVVNDGRHSVPTQLTITSDTGASRVVDVPAVPDQSVRSATVLVPLRFEPLTGTHLSFTISAIRPVTVQDFVSELRIPSPVGIAELGIPGVLRAPMPTALPDRCVTDLLTVDGRPFPFRVAGSTAAAVDHQTLRLEPCDPSTALALGAGEHQVDGRMDRHTGLAFDRLVLSSDAGGAAAPVARLGATASTTSQSPPALRVVRRSSTSITARVEPAAVPFWMVLGESFNAGWTASVDGHDLGAPRLVDGYANGWLVRPTGAGPLTITLRWTPQRAVNVALVLSAIGGLLCLGIVAVSLTRSRRRRRTAAALATASADASVSLAAPVLTSPFRSRGHTPRTLSTAATVALTAIVAAVLVRPWSGVLAGALVLLVLLRPRWRGALSIVPATLLGVGGLYVAVGQLRHHYAPLFNWPSFFPAMRTVGWLAIVLLAADVVVGLVRRAEPDAPDEPETMAPAATAPPTSSTGAPHAIDLPVGSFPAEPAPRPSPARALGVVALLGGLGVVLPLAIASHYGALGIPRSDDWSYLVTLFRWVDTGHMSFNAWVSMTLIGQVLLAAPIVVVAGHSITTMQVFGALLGLGGLLALVVLGRQLVRPPWWAGFLAATIAVGPMWGPLAPTFMTDVPAFAFAMLALALACAALGRKPISLPLLGASLATGFMGVTIRQYGIVPVVAIAITTLWTLAGARDWRRFRAALAMIAVTGFAALVLLAWWSSVPDSKNLTPTFPTSHSLRLAVVAGAGFLRLAAILVSPVVVLAGPVRIARRAWRASQAVTVAVGGFASLWLAGTYALDSHTPFVGNYLARQGVLADDVLTGTRPDAIPARLFDLLALFGSLAALVVVLAAVPALVEAGARIRERRFTLTDPRVAVIGLTVIGFAIAYELAIFTGLPVFDRYALPVLPLVGLLLLHSVGARRAAEATAPVPAAAPRSARRRAPLWAGVTIVALAVLGAVYTADSASFDGTRWHVGELAVRRGYSSLEVDGGFEWVSWHRGRGPLTAPTVEARQKLRRKYFANLCVTVAITDRLPPRERIVAVTRSRAPGRDPVYVVALRNQRSCAGHEPRQP